MIIFGAIQYNAVMSANTSSPLIFEFLKINGALSFSSYFYAYLFAHMVRIGPRRVRAPPPPRRGEKWVGLEIITVSLYVTSISLEINFNFLL